MLTEQQCSLIEAGLTEEVEPRKIAAYLCLHMGLMLSEVAALRRADIDLSGSRIVLHSYVGKPEGSEPNASVELLPLEEPRILPIPPHVRRFLAQYMGLYPSGNCFILSGKTAVPAFYLMQNLLTSINLKYKLGSPLSASDLRNAFIRRCIQAGMDLYSLCAYIGIKQPNVIVKRFGQYFTPRLDQVELLENYIGDSSSDHDFRQDSPKQMNLLILGAGSQGPVVREIAEAIGIFDEIAFLDDNPNNQLAIGPLREAEKLKKRFPMAVVSFGDSRLREHWMNTCESLGYILPTLIHPSATISPAAAMERSVVVEARCIVSAGAVIGRGALLSGASVIEVGAHIGKFVHIGSSAIVSKNMEVPDYLRVASGVVVRD